MFMQNKKGWIRIVEAFIAILLITGVLLFLYERNVRAPVEAEEIYKLQNTLLNEVGSGTDIALREDVMNLELIYEIGVVVTKENTLKLSNFISSRIPPGFDYELKICKIEDICGPDTDKLSAAISENKEIYSTERIISATIDEFEPKKLKLFMWRK